jgi:hypothetical protein
MPNCDLSVFQHQFLHLSYVHICLWSTGLTSETITMDVHLTAFEPFALSLHTNIHLYQLAVNSDQGNNMFSP